MPTAVVGVWFLRPLVCMSSLFSAWYLKRCS